MPKATCSVDGCERPHHARGFCNRHYAQARREGMIAIPVVHGSVSAYTNARCRCDVCCAAASDRYRTKYAADPEKFRERSRTWHRDHPEVAAQRSRDYRLRNADRLRERRQRYYADNREALIAASMAWAKANPDAARAKKREWKKRNPGRVREAVERRRARKEQADTRIVSDREWGRLCARFHGCCAYCGGRRPLTQDHVVPLSRGGRHAIGNLLPVCQPCNSSKGAKLLVEWRATLR